MTLQVVAAIFGSIISWYAYIAPKVLFLVLYTNAIPLYCAVIAFINDVVFLVLGCFVFFKFCRCCQNWQPLATPQDIGKELSPVQRRFKFQNNRIGDFLSFMFPKHQQCLFNLSLMISLLRLNQREREVIWKPTSSSVC